MSKEIESKRKIEQARPETILMTAQAEENRKRELADEEASKRNADTLKRLVEEGRTEK